MSNVVAFRRPDMDLDPPSFEAAWQLLTDTMRRRSEAKAKCAALWDREARRLSGHADLLARLRTYLRDDKDVRRTGGPGLQVLLRSGRLDHWAPMPDALRPANPFPDATTRDAVRQAKGEGFCRSYLDRCEISGTKIIVPTETAIIRLREVAAIMKAHGYTGMKKTPTITAQTLRKEGEAG